MVRTIAKAALLLAALGMSGCGLFRSRTARLTWPPPGAEPAPSPPASAPAVSLQRLEDRRPEPGKVVGEIGVLDVETPDEVAGWATAALGDELQRAGVRVVPRAAGVPVVGGEVRHVRVWSGTWRYSGEVRLRAWMRSGDAVTYQRARAGRGDGRVHLQSVRHRRGLRGGARRRGPRRFTQGGGRGGDRAARAAARRGCSKHRAGRRARRRPAGPRRA